MQIVQRTRWQVELVALCLAAALVGPPVAGKQPGSGDPQVARTPHLEGAAAPESAYRWAKLISAPGTKAASIVQETGDGGMVFDGQTNSFGAAGQDYWMFKLDSTGAQAWAYLYGTAQDDGGASQPTSDGGYIVHGWTMSGLASTTTWVMKLDSGGAITWQKTYTQAFSLGGTGLVVSKILSDGYLLSGLSMDMQSGSFVFDLVKIDLSGNIVWQKSYSLANKMINGGGLVRLSDGSLVVGGMITDLGTQDSDLYLMKLTSTGDLVWAKTYGGPMPDYGGTGVFSTADGGFFMAGQTKSWGMGGTQNGLGDVWGLKLDSSGNIQWQKAYGGTGDDTGIIMPDPAGGYFIGATTTSWGAGGQDIWLAKLDSNGAITWQKTYGGAQDDYGGVLPNPSGAGYLISGTTLSFGHGNKDEWAAKLDASGNITWQFVYGTSIDEEGASYWSQPSGDLLAEGYTRNPTPPSVTNSDFWAIRMSSSGDLGTSCPFIQTGTAVVGTASGVATTTTATPVTVTPVVGNPAFTAGTGSLTRTAINTNPTSLCSVGPPALSASSSADKTSGAVPLTVQFTGSASGGTAPYTYDWNFGDGSAHSSTQSPSHAFSSAGDFTVTLTVHDAASGTATDSHLVIHVTNPGGGRTVTLAWDAPVAGGANPPQNLQVTSAGFLWQQETTISEQEPNGCPTDVGGGDTLQVLTTGTTVNGDISPSDTEGCLDVGVNIIDTIEDVYKLSITESGTYTFTLSFSSGPDLDVYLLSLPDLTILNPTCGAFRCGITCDNPETLQMALDPGTYLLGVNLAGDAPCSPEGFATYSLSVSGGPSAPVLQGYNVYRATVDSDPSYAKINGGTLPTTPRTYSDTTAPSGTLYYRVKALYDTGESGFSNTATATGATCSVTCTATVPSTGTAGSSVAFASTATPSGCAGSPTFDWDFGDGTAHSSQQNPSHTYGTAGIFTWALVVSAGGQTCSKSGSITIQAGCSLTCTATVPSTGTAGASVAFASSATPSGCAGSPSFDWDFGDGTAHASQQNPSHTYAAAGTFSWALLVSAGGQTCSQSGSIAIQAGCSLTCTATVPGTGSVGAAVSFASAATTSNCSTAASYAWTFGDGATSSAQNPTHAYAAAGNYSWSLLVTADSQACSKSGSISVAAPLSVSGSASPTSGSAPLTVNFTSSISGGVAPYTVDWNFGDGSTHSSSASPSHAYTAGGTFTATLSVSDSASHAGSRTFTITVTVPPPVISLIKKSSPPWKIVVTGSNMKNGIKVYIDGVQWTSVVWKSLTKIQLTGSTLKATVPKGTTHTFRFVNPDGGEASQSWGW